MHENITKKQLLFFGLIVGGSFALIGVWPFIVRHEDLRWWCIGLAVYLAGAAVTFPSSLRWFYKNWMRLGHIMGWVNTRIVLGLGFYGLVTPIGLWRSRLLKKDPLGRNLDPQARSYRVICKPRPASHLTKQY